MMLPKIICNIDREAGNLTSIVKYSYDGKSVYLARVFAN